MKHTFLLSLAIMALSACTPTQQQSVQNLSEADKMAIAISELESAVKIRNKQMLEAEYLAKPVKNACVEKRLAGVIKTYAESAKCSNQAIISAFERVEFPYMDLVHEYANKRIELLAKLDSKKITQATFDKRFEKYLMSFLERTYARESDIIVTKLAI